MKFKAECNMRGITGMRYFQSHTIKADDEHAARRGLEEKHGSSLAKIVRIHPVKGGSADKILDEWRKEACKKTEAVHTNSQPTETRT